MKVELEIGEKDLRELALEFIRERLHVNLDASDVVIEVKSKQNYRSEWESAAFRARVSKDV